jgi:uncharacterized protein
MRNGFQIFDTHTHIGCGAHNGISRSAEELLARMDEAGVDRAAVIPFPVLDDCRKAHDLIGAAVADHPSRLVGVAYVYPLTRPPAFRDEVRRCVEELGFRALKLQPQYQPINPLDQRSAYVFETACEFGLSVICHTGNGVPMALPSLFMPPARQFPDLKVILAHAGGGGLLVGEAIVAALFCPNIYLELSSLMPNHLRQVLTHLPSSRLLIGSDVPENLETEVDKIAGLSVSPDVKQDILWNTAVELFGAGPA